MIKMEMRFNGRKITSASQLRLFRRRAVALGVHREEEGNLLVGTRAGDSRDGRGEGLEV